MKRIVLIITLIVIAFVGFSQSEGVDLNINNAKLNNRLYGDKSGGIDSLIVPDADSIGQYNFMNMTDPSNDLDGVNLRTLLSATGTNWDSLHFDTPTGDLHSYFGGSSVGSTSLNGKYLILSDLANYIPYTDTTTLVVTITQLNDSLAASTGNSTFTLTLPIAGTLSGSVALMVESTEGTDDGDYPFGWVIAASGGDLQVNHGLSRYSSNTTIKYNTAGVSYRQLRNFDNAYSGLLDVDNDNITIESISTFYTAYELKITISF